MIDKPEVRRFPPPWTVEETDACFIVKDQAGHSLAYAIILARRWYGGDGEAAPSISAHGFVLEVSTFGTNNWPARVYFADPSMSAAGRCGHFNQATSVATDPTLPFATRLWCDASGDSVQPESACWLRGIVTTAA